jgi:hypothetical protein
MSSAATRPARATTSSFPYPTRATWYYRAAAFPQQLLTKSHSGREDHGAPMTQAEFTSVAEWPIRALPTPWRADDDDNEQVAPRVPGHSKARQHCLARQYSGHDALPADCKFPSQSIVASLRIRTSNPPSLAWRTPPVAHAPATVRLIPKKRKAPAAGGRWHVRAPTTLAPLSCSET